MCLYIGSALIKTLDCYKRDDDVLRCKCCVTIAFIKRYNMAGNVIYVWLCC